MSGKNNYKIRNMSRSELELVMKWAAVEKWEPGKYDLTPFHVTDPQGFFIGVLNDEPVASLSAVKYSDKFAFIGFYIVLSEFRKQGYGLSLCKFGLEYLKDCVTIGCDGVIEQQGNYKKFGFKSSYRHIRYTGQLSKGKKDHDVTDVKNIPFYQLLNYESHLFPVPRPSFLAALMGMPEVYGLAVLSRGEIKGYGFIRPSLTGYRIGPLFADDSKTAENLFFSLSSYANNRTLFIDIPDTNQTAIKLVEGHNFKPIFETVRMYRGKVPSVDIQRTYATFSLEIG